MRQFYRHTIALLEFQTVRFIKYLKIFYTAGPDFLKYFSSGHFIPDVDIMDGEEKPEVEMLFGGSGTSLSF